jgi:hypothetical protein
VGRIGLGFGVGQAEIEYMTGVAIAPTAGGDGRGGRRGVGSRGKALDEPRRRAEKNFEAHFDRGRADAANRAGGKRLVPESFIIIINIIIVIVIIIVVIIRLEGNGGAPPSPPRAEEDYDC